uniref:UPAR/Ly6 domain-containing protein n=1 Tax=Schistosoma mansoni TaxID=6183 RepID=A0A5K4FFC2_SCHMA
MRIIVESSLIILTVLQLISYAFAIKCRVCLPCEEKYKKLFQITKDEILHNCGVCITAYSTFQGYQMEGRGCLLQCPPKHSTSELTPGLVNKYDCCYYDLCNRTNKLFVQYKLLMIISCLVHSLFIVVNRYILIIQPIQLFKVIKWKVEVVYFNVHLNMLSASLLQDLLTNMTVVIMIYAIEQTNYLYNTNY